MFPCCSLETSHPRLLPQSPKVCSVHLCLFLFLFQNFPQFIVIHIVNGFGIVNKAEIYVFLELSCFFDLHELKSFVQAISLVSCRYGSWIHVWSILNIAFLSSSFTIFTDKHRKSLFSYTFHKYYFYLSKHIGCSLLLPLPPPPLPGCCHHCHRRGSSPPPNLPVSQPWHPSHLSSCLAPLTLSLHPCCTEHMEKGALGERAE